MQVLKYKGIGGGKIEFVPFFCALMTVYNAIIYRSWRGYRTRKQYPIMIAIRPPKMKGFKPRYGSDVFRRVWARYTPSHLIPSHIIAFLSL
jgi:hypothetical protein